MAPKRQRNTANFPEDDPRRYCIELPNEEARKRWSILYPLKMISTKYACEQALDWLGLSTDVWRMVDNVGWGLLMRGCWDSYRIPTLEFLSTLRVREARSEITFRSANQDFSLNFEQLRNIYGVSDAIVEPLEDFNADDFWSRLNNHVESIFDLQHAKATKMRNPVFRYLQKMMAYSIFVRAETGNMRNEELWFLYAMLRGIHIDAVPFIAGQMKKVSRMTKGTIVIGGLITPILMSVNISLMEHEPVSTEKLIDMHSLLSMKIIHSNRQPCMLRHSNGELCFLANAALTTVADFMDQSNWGMATPAHMKPDAAAQQVLGRRVQPRRQQRVEEEQDPLPAQFDPMLAQFHPRPAQEVGPSNVPYQEAPMPQGGVDNGGRQVTWAEFNPWTTNWDDRWTTIQQTNERMCQMIEDMHAWHVSSNHFPARPPHPPQ